MSLRKFHIFFIVVSGLLNLFLIAWGIRTIYWLRSVDGFLCLIAGVLGVICLSFYLKWFLSKIRSLPGLALTLLVGAALSLEPRISQACAVCFKDPDSPIVQSMLDGVAFLLVVIVGILAAIFFIGRSWLRRAKALKQAF